MAKPYKDAHDLLLAGMGTAAKYHDDWKAICADLDKLVIATGFDPKGKRAVVVGRSNLVGKPVALLLLERHATVTIAHSRTHDLGAVCAEADVVIAAAGKIGLVRGEWINVRDWWIPAEERRGALGSTN